MFVTFQTYIGSVVVSINPYRQLGIYGTDIMEEYRGVNFYEMPPHMYVYNTVVRGFLLLFTTRYYGQR